MAFPSAKGDARRMLDAECWRLVSGALKQFRGFAETTSPAAVPSHCQPSLLSRQSAQCSSVAESHGLIDRPQSPALPCATLHDFSLAISILLEMRG